MYNLSVQFLGRVTAFRRSCIHNSGISPVSPPFLLNTRIGQNGKVNVYVFFVTTSSASDLHDGTAGSAAGGVFFTLAFGHWAVHKLIWLN
jgi:hypothetical protein